MIFSVVPLLQPMSDVYLMVLPSQTYTRYSNTQNNVYIYYLVHTLKAHNYCHLYFLIYNIYGQISRTHTTKQHAIRFMDTIFLVCGLFYGKNPVEPIEYKIKIYDLVYLKYFFKFVIICLLSTKQTVTHRQYHSETCMYTCFKNQQSYIIRQKSASKKYRPHLI